MSSQNFTCHVNASKKCDISEPKYEPSELKVFRRPQRSNASDPADVASKASAGNDALKRTKPSNDTLLCQDSGVWRARSPAHRAKKSLSPARVSQQNGFPAQRQLANFHHFCCFRGGYCELAARKPSKILRAASSQTSARKIRI